MDKVISQIEGAFSNVVLGSGIGLWEAQAIDDYESKEVQEKFREKDEKENWALLSSDVLQRCNSSLSFFDAEGMRFHLPAFIIGDLKHEVNDPIYNLTQLDEYTKSQLTSLNKIQRKAITVYLKFCLSQDEYNFHHPVIRRALNEYWEN